MNRIKFQFQKSYSETSEFVTPSLDPKDAESLCLLLAKVKRIESRFVPGGSGRVLVANPFSGFAVSIVDDNEVMPGAEYERRNAEHKAAEARTAMERAERAAAAESK